MPTFKSHIMVCDVETISILRAKRAKKSGFVVVYREEMLGIYK